MCPLCAKESCILTNTDPKELASKMMAGDPLTVLHLRELRMDISRQEKKDFWAALFFKD